MKIFLKPSNKPPPSPKKVIQHFIVVFKKRKKKEETTTTTKKKKATDFRAPKSRINLIHRNKINCTINDLIIKFYFYRKRSNKILYIFFLSRKIWFPSQREEEEEDTDTHTNTNKENCFIIASKSSVEIWKLSHIFGCRI